MTQGLYFQPRLPQNVALMPGELTRLSDHSTFGPTYGLCWPPPQVGGHRLWLGPPGMVPFPGAITATAWALAPQGPKPPEEPRTIPTSCLLDSCPRRSPGHSPTPCCPQPQCPVCPSQLHSPHQGCATAVLPEQPFQSVHSALSFHLLKAATFLC